MGYQLIDLRDLLTVEWLSAIGTIATGTAAAYAAWQAVRLAKQERERILRSEVLTAKTFGFRVITDIYHAANNFKLKGACLRNSLEKDERSYDASDELRETVHKHQLAALRKSIDTLLLLPEPLPTNLSIQLAALGRLNRDLDQLKDMTDLRLGRLFLTDEGMEFAPVVANETIDLGDKLLASALLLEEFLGSKALSPTD